MRAFFIALLFWLLPLTAEAKTNSSKKLLGFLMLVGVVCLVLVLLYMYVPKVKGLLSLFDWPPQRLQGKGLLSLFDWPDMRPQRPQSHEIKSTPVAVRDEEIQGKLSRLENAIAELRTQARDARRGISDDVSDLRKSLGLLFANGTAREILKFAKGEIPRLRGQAEAVMRMVGEQEDEFVRALVNTPTNKAQLESHMKQLRAHNARLQEIHSTLIFMIKPATDRIVILLLAPTIKIFLDRVVQDVQEGRTLLAQSQATS